MSKVTIKSGEVKRDPWAGVVFPCVARNVESGNFNIAHKLPTIPLLWEPVNAIYSPDAQNQAALTWDDVTLPWPCEHGENKTCIAISKSENGWFFVVNLVGKNIGEWVFRNDLLLLPGPITITFEQEVTK